MAVIYIYLIATMECIARPTVTTVEEFKKNPNLFYPDWNEETMKYSTSLLSNPVLDEKTGEFREMTEVEKIKAGKTVLSDGSYLDEVNETIVTIAKPNDWSVWDKDSHAWKVDNNLLNKKLKELRTKASKDLAKKIQDIIEIADVAEQMAVVGISRYTIEQMLDLNVKDFFQN